MAHEVEKLPKKREAFKAIRAYMLGDETQLRVEEEAILNRWIYCDTMIRRKDKDESGQIEELKEKFSIKAHTARNDIYAAQRLFADARRIVKKYLIHLHLERIDQDIQRYREMVFRKDKETGEYYAADPKDISALAKLQETYTYTLNSMPDIEKEPKAIPPKMVFLLAPGQTINAPLDMETAMKNADAMILKQDSHGTYTAEDEQQS